MTSPTKRYCPLITLKKALATWLHASAATTAGVAAVKCPQSWADLKATWPTLIVPLALAAYRAYVNWRKHHAKGTHYPTPGPRR